MPVPAEIQEVPGAAELHDWFGFWPNFHDAEIISLYLNRAETSSLQVHTWEMTRDLDEKGYYIHTKHLLVEFILEKISGLNLDGFNHQNVILDLGIMKTDAGFRLTLAPCYGLAGFIECEKISLRLVPGMPVA